MADTDQIKVIIRVRPLIQREQQSGQDAQWVVKDEKVISQRDQPSLPPYAFDQIYDRDCSTWELYSGAIAPIVEAAMNGYHGTVFAYGQSGSGKTYTMSGDKMTPGIISQAMNDIFDFIEQKPTHEFLMRASYMEIYNEKIYDLLSKEDKNLKVTETPDHQINVVGLEESLVNSCEQVLNVIQKGEAKRTFAETKQNDRSSRSHCIFRIIIESRKLTETDAVMVSHLNFVDLAGSERAGENSGDRFREGCSINLSLFCLSTVISKLSEGVSNQFIGYRNSKLTRILQNALGGNSKTVIVATINPTTIEESHSTLKFATRAKRITTQPQVNEVLSDAAMLKKYRNEITRLQKLVKDMGVADIQSANEDLRKQLDDKHLLIKELTQQIVSSSSLSDKTTVQKKKMRRETWCAPKVRRKTYFPSFTPTDRSHITISEETDLDLALAHGENLNLPFTSITVCANDEAKTKAFLRRSDEVALSESLLSGTAGGDDGGRASNSKDLAEEVERLEEVIKVMEEQHTKEVDELRERIKQLEFEKAVEDDHHKERDSNIASGQEEIVSLKEKLEHMQYEHQLYLEENIYLQKQLWHAEEDNKRLTGEASHLRNKRFDISLVEWEQLEAAKSSVETEMKQLMASLHEKEKEIGELQKALAGQEPYIARLEQQLETFVGAGNGQLPKGGKRRSGIPVLVKTEDKNTSETEDPQSVKVAPPVTVDCSTSTEDLPEHNRVMMDVAVSTDCSDQSACEELTVSAPHSVIMTSGDANPNHSMSDNLQLEYRDSEDTLCAQDLPAAASVTFGADMESLSPPCSKIDVSSNCEVDRTTPPGEQEPGKTTPERSEVIGTAFGSAESSTKLATRLKRRSDGTAALPLDLNSEMSLRLREREQEIEQLNSENTRMMEVLNQANSEIVRYKEAMEAMEQADAERLDELSEVPKLRALLSRRDMEIQRLESVNDRLKEELTQQALNSSASSLSSSFTEPRRKSTMLKEREAEIWKLKDQLVQQAKRLEDIQQEKVHLEDMVVDLQNQPTHEDENVSSKERTLSSSSSSTSSSALSMIQQNTSDEVEDEGEREPEQVTVTAAELEAVQRMLNEKDSLISHLKSQLQEKEEEMEQMFEGQMLIPSDMIQTHLQQAEQQKQMIEDLTGQLNSREEEVARLKARAEARKCSSGSQGEENSFLEQLIMEKMSLEETVQEKVQELNQALEENKDLQIQLSERRSLINQLRQQHEDATEALLLAQKEFMTCKNNSVGQSHQEDMPSKPATETEVLKTVEEESSLPKQENLSKDDGIEVGMMHSGSEATESVCEVNKCETSGLVCTKECKEDLQTKVAHLSHVEECLEQNIKMMQQTEEEKEAFRSRVQDLETQLEELTAEKTDRYSENIALLAEKEALNEKVKDLSSVVDTLQSKLTHLESVVQQQSTEDVFKTDTNSENLALIAEKEALNKKVKDLSFEVDSLQSKLAQLETAVQQQSTEDVSSQITELSATIDTQNAKIHQLQSENDQLISQKNALEKEVQDLKAEEESLQVQIQNIEDTQAQLTVTCEQRDALEIKVQEFTVKVDELTSTVAQLQADHEEIAAELTWQTKESEKHQSRVEELEAELCEQKQEADDLVQELEKAQKLQETSEQCQRVVEDTLEVFKSQNAQLEIDKQTLATERDEFELREEAACKEQERLRLELKVTSDRLQDRVSALELELQTAVHRKELLEAALADKESAQHMGELLHEKLSVDLQESQAEVSTMKTTLSHLQSTLQSQESKFSTLSKITSSLETERDHLTEVRSSLEMEKAELSAKLLNLEEEIQALRNDLSKKQEAEEAKTTLQTEVAESCQEVQRLQDNIRQLKQQLEARSSQTADLQQERDSAQEECGQLTEKLSLLESRFKQAEQKCQELNHTIQQLRQAQSESEKKAVLPCTKCSELQDELGSKLENIEQLQKELEAAKSSAGCSSASGEKMVPLMEVKKQKFALINKIKLLTSELENIKEAVKCKDWYMTELQEKLAIYENEEQESKDEKIESLENNLKAKEMELVGLKMQQQEAVTKLSKQLSNAEEMVTYKEQMISKLKGEIRRIRSEEVSFCTPAVPKAVAAAQEPAKSMGDERVISSHSGIIDRYTVTLLEADKFKLQKELKKTQDRLKHRESELHWAKVALAKAKTGGSPTYSSLSPEKLVVGRSLCGRPDEASSSSGQTSIPVREKESDVMRSPSLGLQNSASIVVRGPCSPVITKMGSSVDAGADSVTKTVRQRDDVSFLHYPTSAGGTSVDFKKDRCVLPSAVDKENTPMGVDVLATSKASAAPTPGESPINIEPEFWKKAKRPHPAVYRPSSKNLLGKSAGAGADQCKTQ